MTIRTYTELIRRSSIEDRFAYLDLKGSVGEATFGYDRWLNQDFYRSRDWKQLRNHVILRDEACDLGVSGYEIHGRILVHHMNPIAVDDFKHGNQDILDPEFLITCTFRTHNAIHYGDERLLPQQLIERKPGDTKLW